jgi:tryptophanyl-tRNA synthetase
MRARRAEIEAHPGYVDEVLKKGAARANAVASATMTRVRTAVGLV